jgi:hypothetical protein
LFEKDEEQPLCTIWKYRIKDVEIADGLIIIRLIDDVEIHIVVDIELDF